MTILSSWLAQFYAQNCLLCHDLISNQAICSACLNDLLHSALDAAYVCPICAGTGNGVTPCRACQTNAPSFDRLWASVYYEPPISGILHEFKHNRQLSFAKVLAELMIAVPPPWLLDIPIDGVLAMPLSHERRLMRGFNQCEARILAQYYGWQLLPQNTVLRRPAPPQSTLAGYERQKNVAGIFSVARDVKKCNLLLIDDVCTTGATLNEIARMLKLVGVSSLSCWTLARTQMQKN